MPWSNALIIIAVEIALGCVCGKVLIPCFRKLKTGKYEMYLGDRFAKDGSEPKFGGVIISLPLIVGAILSIAFISGNLEIDSDNDISKIIVVVIFSLLFMMVGIAEDWMKDVRKSALGLRLGTKLIIEFILCLCFLLWINVFCGDKDTAILLPFRLGYLDSKLLYYPLMAVGMTITINAVKLHDCFGGDTSNGTDGLCAVTAIIFSLMFAVYGNIADKAFLSVLGYISAAAVMGFLIWGLSPSKIYLGESGALLLGGFMSAIAVVSKLHLLILMTGLGFFIDSFCTIIQYAVFRKSKKLVFKGASLHAHWKEKGFSDYKVILIFSCITVIGGIAGMLFVIYSTKF
ncbi:MAG: hypothetical protein K2F81_04675 [Ruminococcus sp.]|nr:hypothetical protein [Ruminococcus sp.]